MACVWCVSQYREGNDTVEIEGDNATFVRSLPSVNCTTETTLCSVVSYTHSEVRMHLPAGLGPAVEVFVYVLSTTSAAVSVAPATFDYQPPSITSIQPNPLDVRGGVLSIYGENFGSLGSSAASVPNPLVRVNGTPFVCCRSLYTLARWRTVFFDMMS